MYIWVAVLFNKEFEKAIREQAIKIGDKNNLDSVAFDLPQHISLKISFPCNDVNVSEVVDYLVSYLEGIEPFMVKINNIELVAGNNNIIWMNILENEILRELHNNINGNLLKMYNIKFHEFDGKKFKFHSTLFIDDKNIDVNNYKKAFEELQLISFNKIQSVDGACIGVSKSGKMGTFEVSEFIEFKNKKTHM
jgi:2'-5' RNA ligase